MAGVDAPELSHGDKSFHAPQPYAQEAAAALSSLIKGSKNLELIYDPTQTTYGRMMGAVIADGKNLNFEVVRQGLAAFLPYGKSQNAMIDYQALGKTEKAAYEASRGMWAMPWEKTFYEFSQASGQRLTFNTLASRDKIAENTGNISLITMMEMAQANGQDSAYWINQAAQLGKSYRSGSDLPQPMVLDYGSAITKSNDNLMADQTRFMRTHGTGISPGDLSHTYGKVNMDSVLAVDSMGSTNAVFSRSQYHFDVQNSGGAPMASQRRKKMAAMQRAMNQQMFLDPGGRG